MDDSESYERGDRQMPKANRPMAEGPRLHERFDNAMEGTTPWQP
jgi:hypothetical protein